MNKRTCLIFLVIISFAAGIRSQTTYYISSSSGNNANSGKSESSPWKTISKVNSASLMPGDKILFNSGDKWEEGTSLIIKKNGLSSSKILFGSYGKGNKPIISLLSQVSNWKTSSNWTKAKGDTIWKIIFPNFQPSSNTRTIARLWLNGVEYPRANDLNGDNLDNLTPGQPKTFGVNRKHRFYHLRGNPCTLYVWTNGTNPAAYYSNIEFPGQYTSTTVINYTVDINNADYIILENLDIRGGIYSPVGLTGSDYITIKNCVIGKYTNHCGVSAVPGSDKTSDNVEISNCVFDTDRKVKINFYEGLVEYAVTLESGSNWLIHHNTIKNWNFGFLPVSKQGVARFNEFYNNEVSAPDIEACKPVQLGTMGDNYENGRHKIYNNYFHDIPVGCQIGAGIGSGTTGGKSNNNKFYFNIFKNYTVSESEHFTAGNSGFGFDIISNSDSNYISNNTFYSLSSDAIRDWSYNTTFAYNNLVINCGSSRSLQISGSNKLRYKNNHFSHSSLNSSSKIIYLTSGGSYDVAGFNKLNGTSNRISTGNEWCGSYTIKTINNITVPVINATAHKGIDISSLIPSGFKDRNGITVNRTTPLVGAFQSSSGVAQLQLNAKVFLQAPYSPNGMHTSLNASEKISLSQPYNTEPWNYNGTESVAKIPASVVDWILVELRSDASSSDVVSRRAAFLKNDGTITDLDGISEVNFKGLDDEPYYIVVKHRNHLGIMSSGKVDLSNTLCYDFTISPSAAYGNDQVSLGNGKYGMYCGDNDGNGTINVLDYGEVHKDHSKNGYKAGDVDLNGLVNDKDFEKTNLNLLKASGIPQ